MRRWPRISASSRTPPSDWRTNSRPGGARDRAAERGLADARRADQAEDRALQLVGAGLDGEIFDDPVLDLLEAVMVLVEDPLGLGDVVLELRLLAPGQAEQHVEIVAADRRLGRHRRHRLQLLQLRLRLGPRLLAELGALDLAGELGELVALAFLALIAELALDRLQLLVEIIFALGLLHLALDAAADLLLDLQHAQLALHEGEGHLEPADRIELGEQGLLVGDLDVDVGGDRVGELATAPRSGRAGPRSRPAACG